MSFIPRLRKVESVPQLSQYIEKHGGIVKGRLFYDADQTNGLEEGREDSGIFTINPTNPSNLDFLQNHPNTGDEMFLSETNTPERLALKSVEVQVRSRHKIST